MTHEAYEGSVESADPVYLYEFTIGSDIYRYTSTGFDVTALSETWVSAPINPSPIILSDKVSENEFTISLPLYHELAQLLFGFIAVPVGLTVRSGFLSDPDEEWLVEWIGADCDVQPEGNTCKLNFSSLLRMSQGDGLSKTYQVRCPYAVYQGLCGLPRVDWVVAGSITAISGKNVTVAEAALAADGEYTGGILELPSGLELYIFNHVGDQLELFEIGNINSLALPESVNIYPGCDGSLTRCEYFSNTDNHGGCPWLSDNPFDGSSII